MRTSSTTVIAALIATSTLGAGKSGDDHAWPNGGRSSHLPKKVHLRSRGRINVQLGPRPFFLVQEMQEGPLKERLAQCSEMHFKPTDFSIGHRGATLQSPEHTAESFVAAARMGAGIIDCDVTFTKDRQLVCRHSQCDLHTTSNILATPLAAKCSKPPMWALLTLDRQTRIVPSDYALAARRAGLDIITWTIERSGLLKTGGGYYYQSISEAIDNDGDMLTVLDVLARDVGIPGIFSDWPATVTYFANCMGL